MTLRIHRSTIACSNQDIAHALQEMALFLEMADVPFKPRAYEKAAQAVAGHEQALSDLYAHGGVAALEEIPGIGEGIAKRIGELLGSGHCRDLEALRKQTPVDVLALTSVGGLGPKHVKQLFEALGIRTLAQLETAARKGRIHTLEHFGDKTEQKILRGLAFLQQSHGRLPLGEVLPVADAIQARLATLPGVAHVEVAGSVRRRKETIGDLDLLVASSEPAAVMQAFITMPEVVHVHSRGSTKTMLRLSAGIDADLRVVPDESWGAALCYFTGSKAHNLALRRMAQKRGWKLNEYGLFDGARRLAGRTEREIYAALDLPFIPPELREDQGEIEAAADGKLPHLIRHGSLRGDMQIQTSWTDGADSMEEMALAAQALGLEYIAITDHTRDLPMTHGNDEARLLEQLAAVRALDRRMHGITVLAGAEVNIRRDGTLDIADEVLEKLDVVGVGVHAYFEQPRAEMTQRLIRAIENPHVDILFHPTARTLGARAPCELDMEALLAAAKRTGTALEIDAQPERLDLKDEHVRRAVELGVKLVISSDAHRASELRYADTFGVAVARRGWASRADVLNTRPMKQFLAGLKP